MMIRRTGLLLAGVISGALLLPGTATLRADPATDLATARVHQEFERWAPAESLATAALAELERAAAPDSLAMAEALHLIALSKWRLVGYADGTGLRTVSRSLAIRERRLGANDLQVAESHSLAGRFLEGGGRADSALIHLQRALDVRRARLAPDDTLIAVSWDHIALAHREKRDFHGALEAWTRAIEIRERAHGREHPEVARLIAQTGVPWMELGELDRARQVLEEALGIFARTAGPDHPGRWIPLNILADVENRSGNIVRNRDLLQEALRVVRINYGEDSREALTLRSNIALVLYSFGDPQGSRAILGPLLPQVVAQYGPGHPRALNLRQALALTSQTLGDTAVALSLLREIESTLAARSGPPDPMLMVVTGQQGEVLYRRGRYAEARALQERSIQIGRAARRPNGSNLAQAQGELLQTLVAIGDTAAVERTLRELLEIDKEYALGSTPSGSIVQYQAARATRALGRRDEAWTRGLEAERLAHERYLVNIQAASDRRALQLTTVQERQLELVIALAREGGGERLETAWDRLVRSRGSVRAELARRRPAPGFDSDTALAGAHERWMVAQRRMAHRVVRAGGAPRDSQVRAALETLRAAAEDAEGAYARLLAGRGAKLATTEVGLAEARARLRPDQALVACYRSRRITGRWLQFPPNDTSDMVAFVARGASGPVELVELGTSRSLGAEIRPWLERLAVSPGPRARPGDAAERECRRLGLRARAVTWDRIAPLVAGATDVFMVGEGPLLDLPWHALPDGAKDYFVEAGPRVHLINAERELAEPAAPSASRSLLAVGAPDYDRGAADEVPLLAAALVRSAPDPCSEGGRSDLGPLPGSGAEAEDVARVWRTSANHEATVRTGSGASEAAFKREAPGRAVIHLATHGVVAGDACTAPAPGSRGVGGVELVAHAAADRRLAPPRPSVAPVASGRPTPWIGRRVWLAMAGANRAGEHERDENEGYLTAEEVLTLDLGGTDWVVLSACHSGLAEGWSRDGAHGMRRAFDLAGARTVIASQWAVDDDATREWMKVLYAERARGLTNAAAALEAANRTVLAARRKAGLSTHPFYWAAFSASGE